MTCKFENDEVYLELMNKRSEHDKKMIQLYNCANFEMTYPKSLVSMMAPVAQKSFQATQMYDPAVQYQLAPTPASVNAVKGVSSSTNAYPPSCGFDKVQDASVCGLMTPYPYPNLDIAYNPTAGSKCINLNQDLNLQYVRK